MSVKNFFCDSLPLIDDSFANYFLEITDEYGEHTAILDPETGVQISFTEIRKQWKRYRDALMRIGIARSETVATVCGNSIEFIFSVLAITGVGARVVPLNPAYKKHELEKYLGYVRPNWILTENALIETIQTLQLAHLPMMIVIDTREKIDDSFSLSGFLCESTQFDSCIQPVRGVDPAVIFFTSGTTGLPKPALFSNGALIANCQTVRTASSAAQNAEFGLPVLSTGDDCVYGVLPYFHSGGLLTLFAMLAQGITVLVNRKFEREKFLETIAVHGVTALTVVPTILNTLAELSKLEDMKSAMKSLKYIFVGASTVDQRLVARIQEAWNVRVIQLYGTTESGAIICMEPVKHQAEPGTCGVLMPGVQCKVVDPESRTECEAMAVGEIWLRTATMMTGYLSHSDNNKALSDGWLLTGDLGYFDSNQFIYICGRTNEMIKVRSWQVSPYELEEMILTLPEVDKCVVIGIPDQQSGQLPKAFIKLHNGVQLDQAVVKSLIEDNFASYKHLVGGVQFVNSMPITATGKIARCQLLDH